MASGDLSGVVMGSAYACGSVLACVVPGGWRWSLLAGAWACEVGGCGTTGLWFAGGVT